jgi:3'5'-cyclic nucleotide phosphodiesterase
MQCCTGFANGYMVNTSTEAAITWNDISVNENMHAATAFQLLRRPACDFLAGLDADDYRFVRRTVIGIVLATDMASHAELLADFSGEEVQCHVIGVRDSHALAFRCGMQLATDVHPLGQAAMDTKL